MRVFERASERWEIELHELRVVTRRFENDVLIDESPVEHSSSLRAKWEADKVCSRLASNGFARVDGDIAALGRQDLEDALRANPDDLDTYLVFADWLSDRGDDWGQLIAVQHALATLPRGRESPRKAELDRTEMMLRFRLGARLWGRLGETVYDEQTQRYLCDLFDPDWYCGFVRAIHMRPVQDRDDGEELFPTLVREVAALPIAMLVRDITLNANAEWDAGLLAAFAAQPWPLVERIAVFGRHDARQLVPIFTTMPRLRHVEIVHTHATDALCIAAAGVAATVETLIFRTGDFSRLGIDALASTKFPVLKKLGLQRRDARGHACETKRLAPSVRVYDV